MGKRADDSLYELPGVDVLSSANDRTELAALLREAHSLKDAEVRLKDVKKRIVELAQGLPGVRDGDLCTIVRWQDGRSTLKAELLVEAGVTPEQIRAGMTKGAGSWICELPRIGG
jgi:hypothetical protein